MKIAIIINLLIIGLIVFGLFWFIGSSKPSNTPTLELKEQITQYF